MQEVRIIPPLGYFTGNGISGIIYLAEEVNILTLDSYEILTSDEGGIFVAFKKRGRNDLYFICPFTFFEKLLSAVKDEKTHITVQIILLKPLNDLHDDKLSGSINFTFSMVDLAKLAIEAKKLAVTTTARPSATSSQEEEIKPFEIW